MTIPTIPGAVVQPSSNRICSTQAVHKSSGNWSIWKTWSRADVTSTEPLNILFGGLDFFESLWKISGKKKIDACSPYYILLLYEISP